MTDKELWEKSQVWESSDDGRGGLKVLESVEKLIALTRADERKACAKECWKQMGLLPTQAWTVNPYEQCIDAIRARKQA